MTRVRKAVLPSQGTDFLNIPDKRSNDILEATGPRVWASSKYHQLRDSIPKRMTGTAYLHTGGYILKPPLDLSLIMLPTYCNFRDTYNNHSFFFNTLTK